MVNRKRNRQNSLKHAELVANENLKAYQRDIYLDYCKSFEMPKKPKKPNAVINFFSILIFKKDLMLEYRNNLDNYIIQMKKYRDKKRERKQHGNV